jgi:hydroxylamine dehydrogenase
MKRIAMALQSGPLLLTFIVTAYATESQRPGEVPLSETSQTCIDCHEMYNPGLVMDWRSSRHAQISPEKALEKPPLQRRVSSETIPENLGSIAVGCYECHSLNPSQHRDNFKHFGELINVIVSPKDCRTCHSVEADQYSKSKKAHARDILLNNPVYDNLVEAILSVKRIEKRHIVPHKASEPTRGETCYNCHGTNVTVTGMKEVSLDMGEIEVPHLTNWPNQGVGRINPDGSYGACTACHPRHSFSIEIARKPYTCSQCHLEPDVPSYNVYKESKHGNIFESKKEIWTWDAVPWKAGFDFRAPTCAVCHNSLIISLTGEEIAARNHNFGSRLWTRLFGIIYSHPQPKDGRTYLIENKDGLPLPTALTGEPASEYLIEPLEQGKREEKMKRVCQSCHGRNWADGHFAQLDTAIVESDEMVLAATQLLLEAWGKGIADQSNLFDEAIEQKWIEQWLFYANSVRYASAMAGPDYASFKNGWWKLTHNIQVMRDMIELKSDRKK